MLAALLPAGPKDAKFQFSLDQCETVIAIEVRKDINHRKCRRTLSVDCTLSRELVDANFSLEQSESKCAGEAQNEKTKTVLFVGETFDEFARITQPLGPPLIEMTEDPDPLKAVARGVSARVDTDKCIGNVDGLAYSQAESRQVQRPLELLDFSDKLQCDSGMFFTPGHESVQLFGC